MSPVEIAIMTLTVNEAIQRYPATIAIFNRDGLDTCCGGARQIAEGAAAAGVDRSVLRAELIDAIGAIGEKA